MNNRLSKVMLAAVLVTSVNATAATVTMKDLASGAVVGHVELSESPYGAVLLRRCPLCLPVCMDSMCTPTGAATAV
ncbi:MAG: hypothetical protein ACRCYW_07500 [Aeromonas sp.]|uniref:hypothetical protein n=1 Tax=Aeromonas sp. TaxID=647 RepID=UPI003F3024A7